MYIFPFSRIRYIKTITINTHIDCLNNSKCSVGDILLATKQGAFESVFGTFSVKTLDEFQSITTGYGRSSSLKYQTYYDLLINACVRYDRIKKANIAKKGHIYQISSKPDNDGLNDKYPMKLQVEIHIWVLIHQVMSFTIAIQLSMFHQCQLGINFSLDPQAKSKSRNIHKETN